MHKKSTGTLRRFFAGITEYTFQARLGVVDPPLIDYISDLLTRFARSDSMYRVRNAQGRPILRITELMAEANHRVGDAKRDTLRHVGDLALYWSGLYPESLQAKQSDDSPDALIDYASHGKQSYWIASTIRASSEQAAPAKVLEALSDRFDLCAYGLREVRREWERRDEDDSPPILLN